MNNYGEIDLASIAVSGKNPRKYFDKKKLEELAESIRQKGVIEPIIVRRSKVWDKAQATGAKAEVKQYELVAGERRFKAAGMAGLVLIPAIVRELTDDEAYDFMLIENLQRDDLTDREEAESFKAYLGRHGEDGIPSLAEKTGISPGYIRTRVRVLELPASVLKAWGEGKLVFGHLQQLLRVAQDPGTLKEMAGRLLGSTRWGDSVSTVGQLRGWINDLAPVLSGAFFPMKETCAGCGSSSIVQKDLFDVDADKARCLNPSCFKKRQNDFLAGHWKETSLAKAHGTNGFRFEDRRGGHDYHNFRYGPRPAEKCKACPNFITIINLDGSVDEPQVCFGRQECFTSSTRPKTEKAAKRDPEAPRAAWHGVYFRDRFLRTRIAQKLVDAAKNPDPNLAGILCLYALAKSNREAREKLAGVLNVKLPAGATWGLGKLEKEIMSLGLNHADLKTIALAMLTAVKGAFLAGQVETTNHEYPDVIMGQSRRAAADLLGISVVKEFSVDKDYLEKKTKAEILAFGKKFKLLKDDAAKLKKPELVKAILAHGPKLVGKVPAEILK